jgi:hypothetical protein
VPAALVSRPRSDGAPKKNAPRNYPGCRVRHRRVTGSSHQGQRAPARHAGTSTRLPATVGTARHDPSPSGRRHLNRCPTIRGRASTDIPPLSSRRTAPSTTASPTSASTAASRMRPGSPGPWRHDGQLRTPHPGRLACVLSVGVGQARLCWQTGTLDAVTSRLGQATGVRSSWSPERDQSQGASGLSGWVRCGVDTSSAAFDVGKKLVEDGRGLLRPAPRGRQREVGDARGFPHRAHRGVCRGRTQDVQLVVRPDDEAVQEGVEGEHVTGPRESELAKIEAVRDAGDAVSFSEPVEDLRQNSAE